MFDFGIAVLTKTEFDARCECPELRLLHLIILWLGSSKLCELWPPFAFRPHSTLSHVHQPVIKVMVLIKLLAKIPIMVWYCHKKGQKTCAKSTFVSYLSGNVSIFS